MALAILRPEIISLRRLLIAEARTFPDLAKEYYARAPGKVIATLAIWMEQLSTAGSLRAGDARRAAEQFAYLVVAASLDRAVLAGTVPTQEEIIENARDGVVTFLARYRAGESAGK